MCAQCDLPYLDVKPYRLRNKDLRGSLTSPRITVVQANYHNHSRLRRECSQRRCFPFAFAGKKRRSEVGGARTHEVSFVGYRALTTELRSQKHICDWLYSTTHSTIKYPLAHAVTWLRGSVGSAILPTRDSRQKVCWRKLFRSKSLLFSVSVC